MSSYNATVYRLEEQGNEVGVLVAEVDGEGRMLRSNWIQFTGLEGTPRYDAYLRRNGEQFRFERDVDADYRRRLAGLMLPPAYQH
jgi:hypothetical protein